MKAINDIYTEGEDTLISFEDADKIISSIKNSTSINEQEEIFYPGERIIKVKENKLKNGILIDEDIWDRVGKL